MDWHEQRQQWNAQDECARKACRAPLRRRGRFIGAKHNDSGLLYCRTCARKINDYNPTPAGQPPLVEWVTEDEAA